MSRPVSVTGSDRQVESASGFEISLGWVQGTLQIPSDKEFRSVLDFVCGFCPDAIEWHHACSRRIGKDWGNWARSVTGLLFCWNEPDSLEQRDAYELLISCPGSFLERLCLRDQWRLVRGLVCHWGFNATRLDISLDDFDRRIEIQDLEAVERHMVGFGKIHHFSEKRLKRQGVVVSGRSICFGSRSSDKFMRVYDKALQSRGDRLCVRWELEAKRSVASQICSAISEFDSEECSQLLGEFLARSVVGAIDFLDRDSDERRDRRVRLPFWQEFLDLVGDGIRWVRAKKIDSMAAKIRWLESQCMASLALVKKFLGSRRFFAWLRQQLRDVVGRWSVGAEAMSRYIDALLASDISFSDYVDEEIIIAV